MSNWPDEVERVAALWKRDCHDAVYGFDLVNNDNIWVSDEDAALPQQIYDRMMFFATPSAGKNELVEKDQPNAGAFGMLSSVKEQLGDARSSLKKAEGVTEEWSGEGAESFLNYLIDLQRANEQVEDIYIRTLEVLLQAHGRLINGIKQDLFNLQKETLLALDGNASGDISVGKVVVEGLKAAILSKHSKVLAAVTSALETALEEGVAAAIDEFGSDDSFLQPYYDFGAGLLKLRGIVEPAVGAIRSGYDELAGAIMRRRHVIEPSRPALVSSVAFDPADFMLPEYLDVTVPAQDGKNAEYEIKSEYKKKIEPKVSTADVAIDEEPGGPRGASW